MIRLSGVVRTLGSTGGAIGIFLRFHALVRVGGRRGGFWWLWQSFLAWGGRGQGREVLLLRSPGCLGSYCWFGLVAGIEPLSLALREIMRFG